MSEHDISMLSGTCGKCKLDTLESQTVRCHKCQTLFHELCVKANDNMQVWSCTVCLSDRQSNLNPPEAPRSKRSVQRSRTSALSNSSSKQQAILEAFDEETKLLEKQAKEKEALLKSNHEKQLDLIKRKQAAISQMASSSRSSSVSSKANSVSGAEKVKLWIHTQPNVEKSSNLLKTAAQGEPNFTRENVHSSTQVPVMMNATLKKPSEMITNQQPEGRNNETFQRAHPITPSVAFNISQEEQPDQMAVNQKKEQIRSLSKEEIAARHVIKALPNFDGNPKMWPRFITSYNRSTSVCGFNNMENLERLSQALTGSAYAAVSSSLMMEDNVPHIIETLELLYGKPEFIINSLLNDLRKTPTPSFENIDSIIKYSLEIENVSSTMVNAKLADHVWNPILLSEMVDRLPTQLKFEWASFKHGNPPCSIEVFSMWLKNKAVTYASILTKPPNITSFSKKENKYSVNMHEYSTLKSCVVCQKDCSSVNRCEKFLNISLQDKWNIIRKLQICRICLKIHRAKRCKEDSICGIDGCQFRHNKILHNYKKDELLDDSVCKENEQRSDQISVNIHAVNTTFFKILPVYISNGNKKLLTYAMFDDGSSLTLMDNSIAVTLELHGEKQPICLRWTNGFEHRDASSRTVCLNISQDSNGREFKLNNVRTIENLQLPMQSIDMKLLSSTYEHLKSVKMQSFQNVRPLILIGLNNPKLLEIKKFKFGKDDEPAAAKTPLGWCLFGGKSSFNGSVLHVEKCDCEFKFESRLEEMVRDNYLLEAIGVSNPSSLPQAKEDKLAIDILNSTVKFTGQRFETGLLWKYSHIQLPNSLPMARKRLNCLEKKCNSDPYMREVINNQIDDYINKGYARKLPQSSLQDSRAWYLPIFIVKNDNKPDKIRMVWDAAASVNGVALNDVLIKGPDLLASLPGVLLRFREHRVAFSGDIKEMFHQILVKESDRKFQRFLWRKAETDPIEVFEMCVLTFGASCSPSCSQFVKNMNADRFKDIFPTAVQAIQTNHYVDDWLQSVDTADDAVNLAMQVRDIHQNGGFLIHKWISNDVSVVRHLEGLSANIEKNMELSPKFQADKVLGMYWKTSSDAFQFILKLSEHNTKLMNGQRKPSKREMLRFLMSIFDPLGLITPILIFPKILLQSVWRSKTSWDEEINIDQHKQWLSWSKNILSLTNLSIPRWVGLSSSEVNVEVHTFVDASEDAFAAAVYFKVLKSTGIQCSLITSKSRVAPLKSLSIPRLELQAAVLGSRLCKFVTQNSSPSIKFVKRFFWTDSETVMKWIFSDTKKYTQYVSCRVGEILEETHLSEWHWISSRKNISDMGTKMKLFEEHELVEWFQGPSFLKQENYPIQKSYNVQCDEELRSQKLVHLVATQEEAEFRIEKWTKLRRVYAFVYRFIQNLKRRIKNESLSTGPLCSEEYKNAEINLIKTAQMDGYREEYSNIKSGSKIKNKRSPIYKDSAFIDSFGVMRARGRVQSTECISYDTKNPMLLPKDHRITEMILQFYHSRYHHMYISTVVNEIKQKFLVPRLKVKLREIRSRCQHCMNRDAQPRIPEEAELPAARITPFTRPFTYIGIDYFGPIFVIVGRSSQKRWIMLTTCLTTRALHLEAVHTLSTDSCILALSRFMNRRGKPREIYTDNGTNFRGSKRELREIWDCIDKNQFAEKFIDADTEWKFIPPASPHMGGAWERMVRTVKNSLRIAMPHKITNDELLNSMLTEVENIINNRPLTYVEIEEHQEALTPNHFILGSSSGVKPVGEFNDDSDILRANWHKSQRFADLFWKRWMSEYLPSLNRRTKWFHSEKEGISVGDIVVVLGEDKRGSWPKGRVIEVHPSRDGKIRSADVQLETGIYTRPVSKLAVLDVRREENVGTLDDNIRIPGGSVASNDKSPSTVASNSKAASTVPRSHPVTYQLRNLRALPHRMNDKEEQEK